MDKYKAGDLAYIIESNHKIRSVQIVSVSGGFYTVRFDNGGGTRVKEHRLFTTEAEAKESIRRTN